MQMAHSVPIAAHAAKILLVDTTAVLSAVLTAALMTSTVVLVATLTAAPMGTAVLPATVSAVLMDCIAALMVTNAMEVNV